MGIPCQVVIKQAPPRGTDQKKGDFT